MILDQTYVIEMPNGDSWGIPILLIAWNRASHFAKEYEGNISESLVRDTQPLFESSMWEVGEWARNNMDWDDVKNVATPLLTTKASDLKEGWVNGASCITKGGKRVD